MGDGSYKKNVRKFYKLNDDKNRTITFTYCNWRYWNGTVSLINMLFEEIKKDFPSISMYDINVLQRNKVPYEFTLNFKYALDSIKDLDLSNFEKLPEDFW